MIAKSLRPLDFDGWKSLPIDETVVLTVNSRMGRALGREWLRGRVAAPAPAVFTPTVWLSDALKPLILSGRFAADRLPGRMLTAFEEAWLWQSVISEMEADDWLLDKADAARLARDAHAIEVEWGDAIPASEHSAEYRRYLLWKDGFYRACAEREAIDAARYAHWQREQLAEHHELWPAHLVLAGLDSPSPAWTALFNALQRKGIELYDLAPLPADPQRVRRCYGGNVQELHAAARWSQEQIDAGKRVALVVPDLAQKRASVCRMLDRILHPETRDPARFEFARRYNVSLGEALADTPVVRSALAALQLLLQTEAWDMSQAAPWLLSPFLSDNRTALDAGEREASWRRAGKRYLSWAELAQSPWAEPWLEARRPIDGISKLRPSGWALRFSLALAALGWPGPRQLSSHEYQAVAGWQEELTQFARLDEICGEVESGAVLHLLTDLLRNRIFQAQSSADTPLQVLGLLEAAGGQYDAVWVMGLTDQLLPAHPRPNPLLPLRWQRRLGTPHSSSERETVFARQQLHDIEACTPILIASYPKFEGDTELRVSPLIEAWPSEIGEDEIAVPFAAPAFAYLNDDRGLPLPEGRHVPGGVRVLELQAKHPLWAYAEARLGVAPLESWTTHPDARIRGRLAHSAIDACWQKLPDQQALLAIDAAQRLFLIEQAIDTGFHDLSTMLAGTGEVWRQVEKEKLSRILQRWLELEAGRPEPFSIESLERDFQWQHKTLRLRMRIDRIDRLDGGLLLIDYKTGRSNVQGWGDPNGKPLLNPQLPLYAVSIVDKGETVVGTAYGNLVSNAKEFGFRARLQRPDLLARPKKPLADDEYEKHAQDWSALVAFWQDWIVRLADDFCDGVATHQARTPSALNYCRIRPFLRELNLMDSEEDDDNAPAAA